MEDRTTSGPGNSLGPYLSRIDTLALSIGSAVGWSALLVMSTQYLSQAGPLGCMLGVGIGALLMILLSVNLSYMTRRYPEAGGVYAFTRSVFGYDRAFLVFWFLCLTYLTILWANATSLPLFLRYFSKQWLCFGYLYTVFGYEVYLGEALYTLAIIVLLLLICIGSKKVTARLIVAMVLIIFIGLFICTLAVCKGRGVNELLQEPAFLPESPRLLQVLHIVLLSPWAFIGFENVTHSAEEFAFSTRHIFKVLVLAIVATTMIYGMAAILSIGAHPDSYANWIDYMEHLDSHQGIESLPIFYAVHTYLGPWGTRLIILVFLSLVITSLIGNLRALGRLFYAAARDGILPRRLAHLNRQQIPDKAMEVVVLLSLPIPFLGRTAVGWLADITTLGACMLFGFVSAATWKVATREGDRFHSLTGGFCALLMTAIGVYLFTPSLLPIHAFQTETYLILIVSSILGFFYLRSIIAHDHALRFGKAIVVWLILLAINALLAIAWTGRMDESATIRSIQVIEDYYHGRGDPKTLALSEEEFLNHQIDSIHRSNVLNSLLVIGLFVLAFGTIIRNHLSLHRLEAETSLERDRALAVAYTDPLTGGRSKHAYVEKEQAMAKKIYEGRADAFALVVCDVNGLKHVNDTLGHAAGDRYIQAAARMLSQAFCHSILYRIGGDEFALLLEGEDYVRREDILVSLNQAIEKNLGTGEVVASLGMSEYRPRKDQTFHAVFTRADAAMYERKKQLKEMGARVRE